jgi:hypothetical protein
MRKLALVLALAVALAPLAACSKGSGAPAGGQAPAAPAATASGQNASGFGVPECDDYISKYMACIDQKVPEAAREQVRAAFEATKASWQQAATTEAGRSTLAMACKQATDTARMAMSAYGCTF